jgi:hypothetical protein
MGRWLVPEGGEMRWGKSMGGWICKRCSNCFGWKALTPYFRPWIK